MGCNCKSVNRINKYAQKEYIEEHGKGTMFYLVMLANHLLFAFKKLIVCLCMMVLMPLLTIYVIGCYLWTGKVIIKIPKFLK